VSSFDGQSQYNVNVQSPSQYQFSSGADEAQLEREEVELQRKLEGVRLHREQEAQRQREEQEMFAKVEEVGFEINELSKDLQNSIALIDQELTANRSELEVLTLGRQNLEAQYQSLTAVDPQNWTRETFNIELDKAYSSISSAEAQVDAVEQSFDGTRLGEEKSYYTNTKGSRGGAALGSFVQGLAYNLPVSIAILVLAYVVYTKL